MTTFLMIGPVALPAVCGVLYGLFGWQRWTAWLGAASSAGVLGCGVGLAVVVTRDGAHQAVWGLVRADSLTALLVILIGAVALLATAASPAFLRTEIDSGRTPAPAAGRQSLLGQAFVAAMALAVLAAHLGLLWLAVEAATIVMAFLIGHGRPAVEAVWRYLVLSSVGIAVAFLGLVLLNFAAARTPSPGGLGWPGLVAVASELDPDVTRIAVALLIIGFGTVVGLAPLHAWLPDAHVQAPAPVSALLSGVLLSVAVYAVLRVKVIADAALGAGFVRTLLLIMALLTLGVAATLLLARRDYQRTLGYSSMANMGLVALGAAVGSRLAIAAVLLHLLGHGLVKAVLFLSAGRILQRSGTRLVTDVQGLAVREPILAGLVGLGVLALLGFPPFSLFASGLGIFRAGFGAGLGWATVIAVVLLLLTVAALLTQTGRMLLGNPPPRPDGPGAASAPDHTPISTAVTLGGGLLACAVLGIAAGPLQDLLFQAADLLRGTP